MTIFYNGLIHQVRSKPWTQMKPPANRRNQNINTV